MVHTTQWILTSTMEFSHYSPAPNNIAEEVIAKNKGKVKVEED
jgi:elongation factor G